ncbi:NADH-quinone oxidoreductase subunit NuoN [Plasticicumulans acidivorans]|uniref:NADH-quinone oxidoreductase subunit N n=1 Tax=Plasticicumulans acidivorans TaxID=886464 RepID=A0A317MRC2_9GAMM|nr:NADH-quinone oxidoreductase subunit NuoN [Plasticicumulans acidivorans]PWV59251.1 NADH dehydrogenase subunit N [Plasticicumulans acidivorans]
MTFIPPELLPAAPEIFVLTMACVILVIDVCLNDEDKTTTHWLCQGALLGGLILTWMTGGSGERITFNGHFVRDAMADVLKVGIFLAGSGALIFARDYLRMRKLVRGEYFVLTVFAVLGMMVMVSAGSFLSVYLGLELLSLSLYALVAFNRDSAVSTEAAMKYFVLGALASGMLLYGISMMYGATGSIDLRTVGNAVLAEGNKSLIMVFGIAFLVVGLGFKFGAVPFHMWVPDVYQGAPTSVTLLIGSAPKIAAFALVMRVLVEGASGLQADWQQMLLVLAVLSIALGNVVAIAQTNIKRMLAYSTISHVGFVFLGIASGSPDGYASSMFYVLTYVLSTVAVFGVIILCGKERDVENISDLKGLNDRSPWMAFLMLILMMSMAGIPFLVGFYAKFAVLQSLVNEGFVGVALFAVLLSVIGAFYYLRVVKVMYFDKGDGDEVHIELASDTKVVASVTALAVLFLGVYPSALMALCVATVR